MMSLLNLFTLRHLVLLFLGWIILAVVYYNALTNQGEYRQADPRLAKLMEKAELLDRKLTEQNDEGHRLLQLLESRSGLFTLNGTMNGSKVLLPEDVRQIAVVAFACNRPAAIKAHVDRLLALRPSVDMFPIIVSQDCGHAVTANVIFGYGDRVTFLRQPNLTNPVLPKKLSKFAGYYKIARHYRWTLDMVFNKMNHKVAIVTEDDLLLSDDFFEYFLATYKLLAVDASLFCVSAWNDNGKAGLVENRPELLYRTDFFPGLGWMLIKDLWMELSPKWPDGFWDDWLRDPAQRKGRACIRPEISRTGMSAAGKNGVSGGLFFEKHLRSIQLNDRFVSFTTLDLSYLLKDNFDRMFLDQVFSAPVVGWLDVVTAGKLTSPGPVRVLYRTEKEFVWLARQSGMMEDMKAKVPRTAYKGIVTIFFAKRRIYFVPADLTPSMEPSLHGS